MRPIAPPRLAPWRATLALLAFLTLGLAILLGPQRAGRRVTVDVLDLLPSDQNDPSIALARQWATGRPGRTMFFALMDVRNPGTPPLTAARQLAGELRARPELFADAFSGFDAPSRERMTRFFFDRRVALRLPVWLETKKQQWRGEGKSDDPEAAWLAAATANDLRDFLSTPEAMWMSDLVTRDPLLLLPTFLNDLADLSSAGLAADAGNFDSGFSAVGPDGIQYALIQAEIAASPMEDQGQTPVFAAIEEKLRKVRQFFPEADLQLRSAGINKVAAETRRTVQEELTLLSNLSLGSIVLLLLLAFRRPAVFAHLLLPIAAATTWAWVICFLFFSHVHVLSIVFSTILVGVAVDYGILTLGYGRPGQVGLRDALRRIRLTLVMGCLTSVGGFLFMGLTELPLLKQMGLSVALGLVLSLGLYFAYLPWMPALPIPQAGGGEKIFDPDRRITIPGLGLVLASLAALWLAQPKWGDNVRALQQENPVLMKEDLAVHALFGRNTDDSFFAIVGPDIPTALAKLDTINRELNVRRAGREKILNVARILPSPGQVEMCRAYFQAHPDLTDKLRQAFDEAGFEVASFEPFFANFEGAVKSNQLPEPAELLAELRTVLPLPLQNLSSDEKASPVWFALIVDKSLIAKVSAETLRSVSAIPLDQTETLNAAFTRYREAAFRLAGLGLVALSVVVLALYGLKRGGFMIALPAVSAILAAAVLGFLGRDLGLLQVVGLLLGICLSSDYSIFLASPGSLPRNARRSIRLSAATVLISFGVLLFSSNPALQGICLTVVLVVGWSLIFCEVSQVLALRPVKA
jgi:predicted exporter